MYLVRVTTRSSTVPLGHSADGCMGGERKPTWPRLYRDFGPKFTPILGCDPTFGPSVIWQKVSCDVSLNCAE